MIVANSGKSDCPMDPSDKRVFHRTKSYPMEKKLRHDKQLGFNSIRDVCKRRAL